MKTLKAVAVLFRVTKEVVKHFGKQRLEVQEGAAIAERQRNSRENLRRIQEHLDACEQRWRNELLPAIRTKLQQANVATDMIIAVEPEWVRRVERDKHGRGPYLQFDAPDDSLLIEECGRWLANTLSDPAGPITACLHIVGITDDNVLFTLVDFQPTNSPGGSVSLTCAPLWNQPLKVYLGSDIEDRNLFVPYDARRDYLMQPL